MPNVFDQFDAPAAVPAPVLSSPAKSPAPANVFDQFDAVPAPATPAVPTIKNPASRSWVHAAGDIGTGLAQGAVSATLAIPQLANTVTGGLVDKAWRPITGAVDKLAGGTGEGRSLAESSQDTRAALNQLKSPQLLQHEQELADTKGFLPSAKKIITDPMLLGQQAAEQIPQFLAPAAAARTVGARVLENVVGKALAQGTAKRVAAGMGAGEAAKLAAPAAQRLGERAASKAAARAVMATRGAIGASQASEQAQQEVLGLDQKVMDANPEYQALIAGGATDAEARQQLAITAGMKAAAIAAPLDTLASGITARLEGNIFRGETGVKGLSGLFTKRGVGGVAKTAGKEGVEETLQEGGEQFAQNVGVQGVDPNKDLMDQVPEQAALGGTIGAVLGAGGFAGSAALSRGGNKVASAPPPGADQGPSDVVDEQAGDSGTPPVGGEPVAPSAVSEPAAAPAAPAAPGSLTDAANAIVPPAGPLGRAAQAAEAGAAAAAPVMETAPAVEDAAAAGASANGQPAAPAPAEVGAPDAVEPAPAAEAVRPPRPPIVPPWIEPKTGVVLDHTQGQVVRILANQIVQTFEDSGSTRIDAPALAAVWGVPAKEIRDAQQAATAIANKRVRARLAAEQAATETAAAAASGAGAPAEAPTAQSVDTEANQPPQIDKPADAEPTATAPAAAPQTAIAPATAEVVPAAMALPVAPDAPAVARSGAPNPTTEASDGRTASIALAASDTTDTPSAGAPNAQPVAVADGGRGDTASDTVAPGATDVSDGGGTPDTSTALSPPPPDTDASHTTQTPPTGGVSASGAGVNTSARAFPVEPVGTKGLMVRGDPAAVRAALKAGGFKKPGHPNTSGVRFNASDRAAIEGALALPGTPQQIDAAANEAETLAKAQKANSLAAVAKTTPKRGGIATNGARVRVSRGKLEYVPHARETLEAYFKPGRLVPGYAGSTDKVLAFRWKDGHWGVRVREVNQDGSPLHSRDGADGEPRVHATTPDARDLLRVLGKPELAVNGAKVKPAAVGNHAGAGTRIDTADVADGDDTARPAGLAEKPTTTANAKDGAHGAVRATPPGDPADVSVGASEPESAFDKFMGAMTKMAAGQARKALGKQVRFDGVVKTVRAWVEAANAKGAIETEEVVEPKIKPLSRQQFNRATNEQQRAHERRMKEAGTRTMYLVDGADLGKIAYDYAQFLNGARSQSAADTGEFGPIHNQFHHDAAGAIKQLLSDKTGEATAALHHKDVGDIDLVYGKEGTAAKEYEDGYGLSHIVKKHPEIVGKLQDFVSALQVKSRSKNRIVLADGEDRAVVRLEWDGQQKTWLLSAYTKESPAATEGRTGVSNRAEPATPAGQEAELPSNTTTDASKASEPASPGPAAQLDDFGERLEGARKFLPPGLKEELGDEQIATQPLSKFWPADAYQGIEDPTVAAMAFAARAEVPAKPRTAYKVKRWVEQVKMLRSLLTTGMDARSVALMEELARRSGHRLEGFFAKVRLLAQLPRETWGRVERVGEYPDARRMKSDEELKADGIERVHTPTTGSDYFHVDPKTGERGSRIVPWGEHAAEHDGLFKVVPFSAVTIDGQTQRFEGAAHIGPDEVQKVKDLLAGDEAKKATGLTKAVFEIRSYRNRPEAFINRKGDAEKRPLQTFTGKDAMAQARAWLGDNVPALTAAWEAVKARDNVSKTDTRRGENRTRVGENRRAGKDVTPAMFEQALGFRGVQFGNWVGQGKGAKDRQGLLNDAYDALLDLADLLGIPSKAISLNGSLGLSLGARGRGRNNAHFEPSNLVINLTKTRGAGSLGHEWFHALDNYFSRLRGGEVASNGDQAAYRENNFITYKPEPAWVRNGMGQNARALRLTSAQLRRELEHNADYRRWNELGRSLDEMATTLGWERDPSHKAGVRPEVERAFAELVQALNASPMAARAGRLDGSRSGDGYWHRIIERGARSFENYLISKLALRGQSNDFLANIRDWKEWEAAGKNADRYPYLRPEEEAPVVAAFDKLFDTVQTRETDDGRVALFRQDNGVTHAGTAAAVSPAQEAHTARIRQIANAALGKWQGGDRPALQVVATPEQLPEFAKRTAAGQFDGAYKHAAGMYDGKTIYIVASAHAADRAGMRKLLSTMAHEGVGHYGIDRIVTRELGADAWTKITAATERLRANPKLASPAIREVLASVEGRYKRDDGMPATANTFAREFLAVSAERGVRNGLLDRVVTAIRRWLRQWLPDLHLSERELRQLLVASEEYMVRGETQRQRVQSRAALAFSRTPATRTAYEQRIEELFNGGKPNREGVRLLDRGGVLDLAGYGDMPVVLSERHAVIEGADKHPLPKAAWLKMPEWIDNPAATFERRSDGHLTMIAPEKVDGRAVVIGLAPSAAAVGGRANAPRHLVLTAYAKDNGTLRLRDQVEQGDLVPKYVDEKKGPTFYAGSGVQFPGSGVELRASNKSLKTGRDLVKYRAARGGGADFSQDASVTGTPAFREFFGASKVTTKDGTPRIVFHGTADDFGIFDPTRSGTATAHMTSTLGNFFAEDRAKAQHYAENASQGVPAEERIVDAYLSIQRPYEMSMREFMGLESREESTALREKLMAEGYDGIHIAGAGQWVTFQPNQIKSASENRGTFDKANPNIFFSRGSVVEADPNAKGLPVANVQRIAREFMARYKGNIPLDVRVGKTLDDIYGPGSEATLGKVAGAYHPARGILTLAADRLQNRAGVEATLRHEILGHYGLNTFSAVDKRAVLDAILASRNVPSLRDTWAQVDKNYADKSADVRAEEVFAAVAESKRPLVGAVWDKVLAAVQKGLRAVGLLRGQTGRAELQDLVRRIGQGIRSGERVQRTFPKTDDAQFQRQGAPTAQFSRDENGNDRPLFSNSAASVESIGPAVDGDQESLLQRAKDWLRGKAEDLVPASLGALQRRFLTELMSGHPALRGAKRYDALVQQLDADRSQLLAGAPDAEEHPTNMLKRGAAAIAEDLHAFTMEKGVAGWFGRRSATGKALADVMHEATTNAVDPSKPYERLKMKNDKGEWVEWTPAMVRARIKLLRELQLERSGDDKRAMIDEIKHLSNLKYREAARAKIYPVLLAKYRALPEQGKVLYAQVRDWHAQMSAAVEAALEARINALRDDMVASEDKEIAERYTRMLVQKLRTEFEEARVEGVYFPLNRDGDYWVSYSDKQGAQGFEMFESAAEQKKFVQQTRRRGGAVLASGRRDGNLAAKDAPSGTFIADVIQTMRKAGASDKAQDEVYQTFLRALPEMSMRKHAIHRKATPGFSDDITRGFAKNAFHGAHQLSRLRYAHRLQSTVDELQRNMDGFRRGEDVDPLLVARGDALLGELKKRHDYIMSPTENQLANQLNAVGFMWFLGASPASALVNLTQNAQVTLPVLGAHHGWPKAMMELSRAVYATMRTGGNIDKTLTDPEELRAYNALRARGDIDKTRAHDLTGLAEGNLLQASPVWAKVMTGLTWMFHKAEVVNREAAGMASYRLARQRGDTFEQGVQYASDIINGTHFDYSAANRPRYMQGNGARVALQFKNYSVSMTQMLYRELYQTFKGESPEVRRVARRALTGHLGMTALLAGLFGLPIINLMRLAANAAHLASGDDDEPWDFDTEFRSWLASHFGADAAGWIADGAVSHATGANIASRVSLSDMWFRDSDRELEGRDAYYNLIDSLLGPLAGAAKNAFIGTKMVSDGQTQRGVEMMLPNFAKNAMKGYRFATQGVNSLQGAPIVDDISTPEAFSQLIGLQPMRVADQQRENSVLKNAEQFVRDRRRGLMNAFALALQHGDAEGRANVLTKIRAFNAKYPQWPIAPANLRASIVGRARAVADAENGIRLNRKLSARLHEMVGTPAE